MTTDKSWIQRMGGGVKAEGSEVSCSQRTIKSHLCEIFLSEELQLDGPKLCLQSANTLL